MRSRLALAAVIRSATEPRGAAKTPYQHEGGSVIFCASMPRRNERGSHVPEKAPDAALRLGEGGFHDGRAS